MTAIVNMSPPHPFFTHLVAILSCYELGPSSTPVPKYNGPHDWQTEAIERSLASIAKRMYSAEDELASWRHPERRKKRRNSDETETETSSSSSTPRTESEDCYPPTPTLINGINGNGNANPSHPVSPKKGVNGSLKRSLVVAPMSIDLDGLKNLPPLPPHRTDSGTLSAPPTSHADHLCPVCGRALPSSIERLGMINQSPNGSPLVVPPGPLAAAAFESGMSAVEELRLLKAQVQDVARVCNVRTFPSQSLISTSKIPSPTNMFR